MRSPSVSPALALPVVLPLLLLAPAAPSLDAAEIAVPADQPTIQLAIDAALPGDTVVVSPGTYSELIDFLGKAITVRSLDGPATTIIDGNGSGPVVAFRNDEGLESVLEGFTIRNGLCVLVGIFCDEPGGILCDGASPTIRGNIIRDNTSYEFGGGAHCIGSNALFEGNEFIDNVSTTTPLLADAVNGTGGGIHISGGAVTLVRNRFAGNLADWSGGGIYINNSVGTTLATNTLESNSSPRGGAITIQGSSSVDIENILVTANELFYPACFCPMFEGQGAGIHVTGSAAVSIDFATIVGNIINYPGSGGGVHDGSSGGVTLRNSIVRGNIATQDPQVNAPVSVTYSDVEGTVAGVGNFDADPLFTVGPLGAYYLSHIATGQAAESPCVGAGDPNATPPASSTTRIDNAPDFGIVDVGYHFPVLDAPFLRGDCNSDGLQNIADAIFILSTLFPTPGSPGPPPACNDACDANDSGTLNIADAVTSLNALFGAPAIPLPPPTGACGTDPTADQVTCASQPSC